MDQSSPMLSAEQAATANAMAMRLSENSAEAIPPGVWQAILAVFMQLISGGCKPTTPPKAEELIAGLHKRSPYVCPLRYRSAFNDQQIYGWTRVNNAWATLIDDANNNKAELAATLVA